jgi:nucleoside-diphosphate-sugar epimerase
MAARNQPTIAMTGATGFLGSHLMAALLARGNMVVVLGRRTKQETLQERISKLLKWFGVQECIGQLEVVEVDLLMPLMGIPEVNYHNLCAFTGQIIHCASDTSFSEHRRNRVIESNVNSLTSILEFAVHAKVNAFHYISTAYASGANDEICRENISSSTDFINVYEESKCLAERIIDTYCKKNSIPLTIIRPSIIYGDSRSGRSLKFNALYIPLQSLKFVRDIYLNDIQNHEGKKSSQLGIFIDNYGYLFLPLKIYLPKEGALNLIPVDYFVDATLRIISKPCTGAIFHVTNYSYTKLATLAAFNQELMKIRGVEFIHGIPVGHVLRNPAEELFDRFISPYRPYLSDSRMFDRTNTDLATDKLLPPEFTFEIFTNCMNYAMKVNWGELVFADGIVKREA